MKISLNLTGSIPRQPRRDIKYSSNIIQVNDSLIQPPDLANYPMLLNVIRTGALKSHPELTGLLCKFHENPASVSLQKLDRLLHNCFHGPQVTVCFSTYHGGTGSGRFSRHYNSYDLKRELQEFSAQWKAFMIAYNALSRN